MNFSQLTDNNSMLRVILFILFSLLSNTLLADSLDIGFKKIDLPNEWVIKNTKALTKRRMTLIFHKDKKDLLGKVVVIDVSKANEITKNCPKDGEIFNNKVCLVYIKDKKDKSKSMPFIHFIKSSKDNTKHKEVTLAFDKTKDKKAYNKLAKYLGSKL